MPNSLLQEKDPVKLRQIDELSESESFHSLNHSEFSTKNSRFKIKVNSLVPDYDKRKDSRLKESKSLRIPHGYESGENVMSEIRKLQISHEELLKNQRDILDELKSIRSSMTGRQSKEILILNHFEH